MQFYLTLIITKLLTFGSDGQRYSPASRLCFHVDSSGCSLYIELFLEGSIFFGFHLGYMRGNIHHK